jgi:hypothetical protein
MDNWRILLRWNLAVGGVAVAMWAAWLYIERRPAKPAPKSAAKTDFILKMVDPAEGVRILHFYASPGEMIEDQHANICYSVTNAESVALDPPVERLWPAINRCFSVRPGKNTTYTLTATGAGGREVKASFALKVVPDPALLPRIAYFTKSKEVRDGDRRIYSLCFATANAERVRFDPPVIPGSSVLRGCFYTAPRRTTTYTLTVEDKRGRTAERKLTVEVPPL